MSYNNANVLTTAQYSNSVKRKEIFKGFNTQFLNSSNNFRIVDIECVKQDLMNHFNTRVGEWPMRPNWGCKIWNLLMNPMSDGTVQEIKSIAEEIIRNEPRVSIIALDIYTSDKTVEVRSDLEYKYFNKIEPFIVSFNRYMDAQRSI